MKNLIHRWFTEQGWTPFAFQLEAWQAYLAGESGLVHAPTGMGKTYAAGLGPLIEWLAETAGKSGGGLDGSGATQAPPPLRVLWLTPLRALAGDIAGALRAPVEGLGLPWTVELRTGDTSASARRRQREQLPTVLVTTPESLSLLLSYPESRTLFGSLRCVVVDEWHELLSSKRGVQTELALARLRRWAPRMRTWGLSATLGNLEEARDALLGFAPGRGEGRIIRGHSPKEIRIETLAPTDLERFPWAGHLGLRLLSGVVEAIGQARSTLVFTNTRAQSEIWFQALLHSRPDWAGEIALHHGSLDRDLREFVEARLREGRMRCVVCTSSLDLGVDFSPVDQVIQIGSPKGVARLLQRAGRSGHRPGAASRILCVPTHAFELVEFAAAREVLTAGRVEGRCPLERPLDVLAQHLVSMALGGGFSEPEMLAEVRTTHAYHHLSDRDWGWTLDFVTHGGATLKAYPQYAKVVRQEGGLFLVESLQVARLHRLSVGTIASESMIRVRFIGGATLGAVEEHYIARLKPGDCFIFAGKVLELIMVHDMTAFVRRATGRQGQIPHWQGGHMALSSELAGAVRAKLRAASDGAGMGNDKSDKKTQSKSKSNNKIADEPEMRAVRPLLDLQARWSRIPAPGELLIEQIRIRDGHYLFLYPFEGRMVHEGLAALLAWRLTRQAPRSIGAVANDYGLSLLSSSPLELDEAGWRRALSPARLEEDLAACLNATEMARRQFREIAQVAGLVFPGYPGQSKSARQLQSSSGLLFDVFLRYDPENLLLEQARREVMENQLELGRMRRTLEELARGELALIGTVRLTPLAFPLWAERVRIQVSSESFTERIQRMTLQLEKEASRELPDERGKTRRDAGQAA